MQVLITRWSIFDQEGQKWTVLSWSWRWNKNPGRFESDWPINQKLDRPNGDVALTLAKVDGPFKRELRDSERFKTQGSCSDTEVSNFLMVNFLLLWHIMGYQIEVQWLNRTLFCLWAIRFTPDSNKIWVNFRDSDRFQIRWAPQVSRISRRDMLTFQPSRWTWIRFRRLLDKYILEQDRVQIPDSVNLAVKLCVFDLKIFEKFLQFCHF